MSQRVFRLLFLIFLVAGAPWAGDDPFVGQWKLNPSRSKIAQSKRPINGTWSVSKTAAYR